VNICNYLLIHSRLEALRSEISTQYLKNCASADYISTNWLFAVEASSDVHRQLQQIDNKQITLLSIAIFHSTFAFVAWNFELPQKTTSLRGTKQSQTM
jgi:hypothetical protein